MTADVYLIYFRPPSHQAGLGWKFGKVQLNTVASFAEDPINMSDLQKAVHDVYPGKEFVILSFGRLNVGDSRGY
jgi:hypothetical protein